MTAPQGVPTRIELPLEGRTGSTTITGVEVSTPGGHKRALAEFP